MKKILLKLAVIATMVVSGCGKSAMDDAKPTSKEFEVKALNISPSKVIAGQRITITSELSNSTGNINYEWKIFFNGQQIGETLSGHDISKVNLNPNQLGEYTIKLTVYRGGTDNSTLEKKFNVNPSNFQYGIWGDTEQTVLLAESDNGYLKYSALVGIPKVTTDNIGLTTYTYEKKGRLYTYYFKDGKLYAGAYTTSVTYYNQNTDLRGLYSLFFEEKTNVSIALGISLNEQKIWNTIPSQITYYDTDALTRSTAIGYGYLKLKAEGGSSLGKTYLDLYKQTSSSILFQYVLVSPD